MPHADLSRAGHGDPSLYRTPAEAIAAPPERLAYVAGFDRSARQPDALITVDTDPGSPTYGRVLHFTDMPEPGDELHHFGWNACSSALAHSCHRDPERRYLLLPGLRSSRLHVLDTRPDPVRPRLVKTVPAEELAARAGYSRPHTLHCGPDGVFLSCLGGGTGADGPGGVALLDHTTFEVLRAWETERGPQHFAYDVWWHLGGDVGVTSEWGTPWMVEDGVVPELLLGRKYGHALHFWELDSGRHLQRIDLGDQYQMVLELRPAHDPQAEWGFAGVVVNVEDLSASVWLWYREGPAF
ncbi:selenium-binding family protein, partial [Kitasatospora sp. A2-31]